MFGAAVSTSSSPNSSSRTRVIAPRTRRRSSRVAPCDARDASERAALSPGNQCAKPQDLILERASQSGQPLSQPRFFPGRRMPSDFAQLADENRPQEREPLGHVDASLVSSSEKIRRPPRPEVLGTALDVFQ